MRGDLRQQLCEEEVGKEDEHGARNDGIRGGFADFDATAFHGVAIVGRDTGNDEGEEDGLDDAHPEEPLREGMLQTRRQVGRSDDVTDLGGGVCTNDSAECAEGDEDGNHGHESGDFGQNQIGSRIDAHDFKRIDLLRGSHGAEFGGNV